MNLNLNFDKNTLLSDWWKIIKENLEEIKNYSEETRGVADGAVTSSGLEEYVTNFVNSNPEYIEAMKEFAKFYAETEDVIDAIDEICGRRLPMYSGEANMDIDAVYRLESAIYFCGSGSQNTPNNANGILINFRYRFQVWIDDNGRMYFKHRNEEWHRIDNDITEALEELSQKTTTVKFGVYIGNGARDRFINLGFTPDAVELYKEGYEQYSETNTSSEVVGGIAFSGNSVRNVLEITENGFNVHNVSSYFTSNQNNVKYYFKIYNNCEILTV